MNKRKKHLKRQSAVIFNAKKREDKPLTSWQSKTDESIRIIAEANIKILDELLKARKRIALLEIIAAEKQSSPQYALLGFIVGVVCAFLAVITLFIEV